jgi:hypothetical protein
MSPAGFEPTISAGERPQTHALHRAATEIGYTILYYSASQFEKSFVMSLANEVTLHYVKEQHKQVEGVRLSPWLTLSHLVGLENHMVCHIW